MANVIKRIGKSELVQDFVGEYLQKKMIARADEGKSENPLYTYPANGLPKLSVKSADRPTT